MPIPRVTQSGDFYNESCLSEVKGSKTDYKPANGIIRTTFHGFWVFYQNCVAVLNALTDYDLFVLEQIMTGSIRKKVLNSAFGRGSSHLYAYCNMTKTCDASSVLDSLAQIAMRIILFQGYIHHYNENPAYMNFTLN